MYDNKLILVSSIINCRYILRTAHSRRHSYIYRLFTTVEYQLWTTRPSTYHWNKRL